MPAAPAVASWAAAATVAAASAAGGQIRAAYLHGSAVLGGWTSNSDVDLLLVAADAISPHEVARAGHALLTPGGCPGTGLECSIVSAVSARRPAPPWPFLLHVATGGTRPRLVPGAGHPGDPDLLMHYVVIRAAGQAVLGPPPGELIGEVSRQAVLGYLAAELAWGLDNAPEAYAVLNACRALRYLADGSVVSKLAGGEAALRDGTGPQQVIRRALAAQRSGQRSAGRAGTDAAAFVRASIARLRGGLSPPG